MSELTSMKNIGPAMEESLLAMGIKTPDELRELGAVEAYQRMKQEVRPRACLMTLYALYGAIHDINCMQLDSDTKEMLKGMLEG